MPTEAAGTAFIPGTEANTVNGSNEQVVVSVDVHAAAAASTRM